MKRTTLFVALALSIVSAAALLNVNRVASDGHTIHQGQQHQLKLQEEPKRPIVDGAVSPNEIPDFAAQEVVLRILASDEPDKDRDRKKAYLRAYGFDENAQAALMLAAREYKRLVDPIEKETDQVKDLNWPNPGNDARAKLNDLQRLKENLVAEVVTELNGRLQTYRSLDKWTNHIANTVKHKIKGFSSQLPQKKVSFLRLFPDPFAAYAQAGGCDPTYVYTDSVYDSIYMIVFGYSSYSAGANNCGHEFTVSTQITHAGAPTVYGSDYAEYHLNYGSGYYDGNFFIYTSVEGYCPVAQVTFPAGNNFDSETVTPYVVLRTVSLPSGTNHNSTAQLTYEVAGSNACDNVTGSLDVVKVSANNISAGTMSDPSTRITSFKVNDGIKTHSIGTVQVANTAFNGSMQVMVSFSNCTKPMCEGVAADLSGGCSKDSNVMTVNKP